MRELTRDDRGSGYGARDYAVSLGEFGEARELAGCGGWVLEREIPGTPHRDARGCYPLFQCRDWSALGRDLEEAREGWVSLVLVADPFGDHDPETLRAAFPDLCRPFKEHFVTDLSQPPESYVPRHHRRHARRAAREVEVEVCAEPALYLDDWVRLYAHLIERHEVQGISAFSRESFARQLRVPGLTAMRAQRAGETLGMVLWYRSRDVAYYHLGAYSADGYRRRVSFALFWHAIEHFSGRLRWLALGAGAGTRERSDDGLSRFKRGWSTGTRTAWLCGRIFDASRYAALAAPLAGGPGSEERFFPAYRSTG